MKKQLLIIFVGLFVCSACDKDKTDKPYVPIIRCPDMTRNMDTINNYIRGNWEWVEEYRVTRTFQGWVTPNTPGENHLSLKLYGDTLQFFTNNRPDSFYNFRIRLLSDLTNYPDDSLPIIYYTRFYTGMGGGVIPIKICKNQLLMQHQYVSSIIGERLWIRK